VVTYDVLVGAAEIEIENENTQEETTFQEDTPSNQEPIAIADALPSSGQAPLEVNFTGSRNS